jgi:uncharacterized protein involved in exopolysaccharide biosynthesis
LYCSFVAGCRRADDLAAQMGRDYAERLQRGHRSGSRQFVQIVEMTNSDTQQQAEVRLVSVVALLWSQRLLVLALVGVFTLAGIGKAFLSQPIYRATVVMAPADSESMNALGTSMLGDVGGLASLVGVDLSSSASTAQAIALLRSRHLTEAFIRERNLLPRIFEGNWDAKAAAWRTGWLSSEPTVYAAYKVFDRQIRQVSQDARTGLVTLQIDWKDPAEGARWGNELVMLLNDEMRDRAIAEADASIALLSRELEKTPNIELRQAITRTIETHVKSRTLASVRTEYAFRILDPAQPADTDDFVRPRRALYVVAAPVVGLLFAIFFVLGRDFLVRQLRPTNVSK